MTFKPRLWYPIAAVLAVANVASVYVAAQPAEPVHATVHAALAVLFALWAQRLKQRRDGGTITGSVAAPVLHGIESEMDQMRQELSDAQERLDFAERLLAQQREKQQ